MKLFFDYCHEKNEEIIFRLKNDIGQGNHSVCTDKKAEMTGLD